MASFSLNNELLERLGLIAESQEVFYSKNEVVTFDDKLIAGLKRMAATNPRLRSRLCTHASPTATLHEMLIVHHRDVYVRPHCHIGKDESFFAVEGEVRVVLFEEAGSVRSVLDLAPIGSGKLAYYRIPAGVIHTLLIKSEWLVFHETTTGPFQAADTIFPDWAPAAGEAAQDLYRSNLERDAQAFLSRGQVSG